MCGYGGDVDEFYGDFNDVSVGIVKLILVEYNIFWLRNVFVFELVRSMLLGIFIIK